MAVSAFQKVMNRLFREFALRNGREPQTPKEWMDLQNEAVQFFNKTKGVPGAPTQYDDITKKMWKDREPPSQGFKPKVIQGGKKEGLEGLLESGAVKKGVAPKTTAKTLADKKERHILFRDAEEDIARIKRENKQAIEDFKKKQAKKKTVEDFRDEGDWDPGGMASGGRIAMAGGGALFKFIEKLFIKASNDIRQGKGKWKGLDQKQIIVQHDNLTKKAVEFQKTGKLPEGTEQYFDVNPHTAFKGAEKQVTDEKLMQKAYDEIAGGSGFTGDYKYDADILAESLAEVQGKVYDDLADLERSGLYNQALKRVTKDLKSKMEFKKGLKDVEEKIELQMFDPKDRLPNQSGGLAYMLGEPTYMKAGGGQVGHGPWTTGQVQPQPQQQPQAPMHPQQGQPNPMKMPQGIPSAAPRSMDPRVMQQQMMQRAMMGQGQQRRGMEEGGFTQDDFNQFLKEREEMHREGGKHQLEKDWKKYKRFKQYGHGTIQEAAEGGRAGFIFGGSAGLKGMWKEVLKRLSKTKGKKIDKFFPKMPAKDRWLEDLGKKLDPKAYKLFKEGDVALRVEGIDHLINQLRNDKKLLKQIESNKALKDEGLDFIMKHLEKSMPEVYGPRLSKYTDIDKDILNMETIKKNLIMQDRKLNADGGRIGLMYGGDPGFAFEYGGSWADWHDQHRNQMPVEDYIQTKLPKERLPFRDSAQTGGRIGFGLGGINKGRRAFMKWLAGILGTGAAAGTGLLKLGKAAKVAPKITETAEVITRGADGMPTYITDLIEVVKAKGTRDVIEGFKRSDYSTVHSYKGVDVIEDGAGNIKIKSDKTGVATDSYTGKTHEGISQENHMQIEKGGYVKNKKGEMVKEGDEYIEGTTYPDMDGKMKDFEEGLDEAIHLDFKEIADEIDTIDHHMWSGVKSDAKKASGGLAHMLGE